MVNIYRCLAHLHAARASRSRVRIDEATPGRAIPAASLSPAPTGSSAVNHAPHADRVLRAGAADTGSLAINTLYLRRDGSIFSLNLADWLSGCRVAFGVSSPDLCDVVSSDQCAAINTLYLRRDGSIFSLNLADWLSGCRVAFGVSSPELCDVTLPSSRQSPRESNRAVSHSSGNSNIDLPGHCTIRVTGTFQDNSSLEIEPKFCSGYPLPGLVYKPPVPRPVPELETSPNSDKLRTTLPKPPSCLPLEMISGLTSFRTLPFQTEQGLVKAEQRLVKAEQRLVKAEQRLVKAEPRLIEA
ncbi:hypothetical protein EGW08_001602 [Elysia chlorotica]|uniref:Uncharacterized protein n=1 Tax=Elysia chlorotica TaxID=188477 RepID=A0A3S1BWP7_ELYCH|nr:hypothetical protein EGW08_001602 [Elysia chlorotica]